MDAFFFLFYVLILQIPYLWLATFAFALIPGLIIGWVLYRKGYGLWATVIAAEVLMLAILVVYNFVIAPVPLDKQLPNATWAVLLPRTINFLMAVHVTRFIPTFFTVRLGYFLARRAASKSQSDPAEGGVQ